MTKKKIGSLGQSDNLRRRAEEMVRGKALQLPENLDMLSSEEQRQLLPELRVHQIELEMQNEALRRTQEELESSRVRYFNLYDLAPVGYFTLSEEGLILEANLTASSLLGVARSALVKKSLTRFIFRKDQDIYYHYRQQLFKTGVLQVCELRLVKKDGSLFWARLESTMAQDSENGDALCRAVISDITEHKQAEESLRTMAEMLDIAPNAIIVHDFNGRFLYVNRKSIELHGYETDEFMALNLYDLNVPESETLIAERMQLIKQKGETSFQAVHIRKDGTTFPLDVFAKLVKWHGVSAILSINTDITERKHAELLLLIQRDLALALSSSHQLEEALSKCLDTILHLSEMDCGRIYLIDQVSGDLNLICHRNLSPAFIKSVSHFKSDSTYTRLVLQGKPLFTRYSELDLPLDQVRKAEGLLAFVVLPLIFENRVIGCLNFGSKKLEDVSEINREVLKTAATLIGEGITRLKIEEELKLSYQKLQKAMKSTIQAIALILEKRDPYTSGHQERVTKLACTIAEEINLSPDKIERLYMAGILHDIGKINVPTEILSKPGRLGEIEFTLIKTHPQVGSDILKEMELPEEISAIVLQHHERMDGSGYPSGLSGEAILPEARILAVADVVEAMASHRPYRPALGLDQALEEIIKNRGKLYDPQVADACLKLFKEKGFQFE